MALQYGSIHIEQGNADADENTSASKQTKIYHQSVDEPNISPDPVFATSSLKLKLIKVLAASALLVVTFQYTTAWMTQGNSVKKAAAVATLSAALVLNTAVAHDFTGSYADPNHTNCLREVQMVSGNMATLSGTDGDPGCPADGSGEKWSLIGKVDEDSIFVDFSPKGGPKDLKGVWEPEPVPGIRWPDGNLWSTIEATQ